MEDGVIGRILTRAHVHVAVVYDGKQERVPTQCKEHFPVFIFCYRGTHPPKAQQHNSSSKNDLTKWRQKHLGNLIYCAFHKHANSEVQKPTDDCVFRCRQSS